MLKHEEQAKQVHGEANDFKAVISRLTRKVIGWTFHVPHNPGAEYSHDGFSWVDLDGDVPSDTYGTRHVAADTLRDYLKLKRQTPVNVLEKRA